MVDPHASATMEVRAEQWAVPRLPSWRQPGSGVLGLSASSCSTSGWREPTLRSAHPSTADARMLPLPGGRESLEATAPSGPLRQEPRTTSLLARRGAARRLHVPVRNGLRIAERMRALRQLPLRALRSPVAGPRIVLQSVQGLRNRHSGMQLPPSAARAKSIRHRQAGLQAMPNRSGKAVRNTTRGEAAETVMRTEDTRPGRGSSEVRQPRAESFCPWPF